MELVLRNDDDPSWHYGSIKGRRQPDTPIDMITHVTAQNGRRFDVTLVVRHDERTAAIEHYPHLGQYWWKRFSGEMSA